MWDFARKSIHKGFTDFSALFISWRKFEALLLWPISGRHFCPILYYDWLKNNILEFLFFFTLKRIFERLLEQRVFSRWKKLSSSTRRRTSSSYRLLKLLKYSVSTDQTALGLNFEYKISLIYFLVIFFTTVCSKISICAGQTAEN